MPPEFVPIGKPVLPEVEPFGPGALLDGVVLEPVPGFALPVPAALPLEDAELLASVVDDDLLSSPQASTTVAPRDVVRIKPARDLNCIR
jgi:hypothetical protein